MHRVGRLLLALTLALGLFFLIAAWLGRTPRHRALGLTNEVSALAEPSGMTLVADPRVALLMAQITTETLVAYERALTGEEPAMINGQTYTLSTRNSYSGEPISQATRYVYEHFFNLGFDVSFHEYTWSGNHWRNVVAERRGSRRPDEIYLITAHLDNLPQESVAPGADDNASGSTAVLVAADLLKGFDLDCTTRFVLFTGEEQGLIGSAAYAADIAAAGEDVRGVLNLDMIGYDSDADPILDLHVRSTVEGSLDIAQNFSQVIATYDLDLTPNILTDDFLGNFSDQKSFWDYGYAAIMAIEDLDDFTPHYHTTGDTLDTLNLNYFAEFARAGVGTFAHMGCLNTGLLTGTVVALDTGLPLSATVMASASGYAYTTSTRSNGTYSLTLPVFTFTIQAQADVAGYFPQVISNVTILDDVTRAQHFILEPWPERLFLPAILKRP